MRLSGCDDSRVDAAEWDRIVAGALAGDAGSIRRLFADSARWANRLVQRRGWLDDGEAIVIATMWEALQLCPRTSDAWRTLVTRRLRRKAYRPPVEVPLGEPLTEPPTGRRHELIDRGGPLPAVIGRSRVTVPDSPESDGVIARLDAIRRVRSVGALPSSMTRLAVAALLDEPAPESSAHRVWRLRNRNRFLKA
jgi:hypothetical protein